jgi:Reverse transcriptase (RNA-dependent DNA polymerase)
MFDRILAHQGPMTAKDPRYKGSSYNLLIEWDGAEPTWEPLNIIAADDKVSCALYGDANGLLDTKGWKYLKREAAKVRKVYKRVHEVLKAKHKAKYKYGIRLPDRTKSFTEYDAENGNTAWADANQLEIDLLEAFEAFKDHGEFTQEKADALIAKGFQYTQMQMIYDVKHDGRMRSWFVAGGHMTKSNGSDSYSSVVSFRTLRLTMLLGELNALKLKVGDVTSAYLMALTKELIFFKAGPEFGAKAGHLMVVLKALYGLQSSGKSWHDLLFDTLLDMGFKPSKANPDIWMQDNGECYEYVCSYVDNLTAIMKEPQVFFNELEKRGFGLKGVTESPDVFLGSSMGRDPDSTLFWGAKRYIARSLEAYELIIGSKPVARAVPIPEKTQPELDMLNELTDSGRAKYMSLIGSLQWVVTLG